MIKTHRRHAIAPISLRSDFPGAGATRQAYAAEALLQRLAQPLQIVLGGTEKQHEAQVRMQQLPRQLLRHLLRIGGLGHRTDDPFVLDLLHRRPSQVRVCEARVYEASRVPRMLLG
ncbi:hypothetical protein D3C76_1203980 [compost metagenome]